jgi:hypothetical protein
VAVLIFLKTWPERGEAWAANSNPEILAGILPSRQLHSKERNVSEISKETGVIAVLAKRMVEERLPKALALKDRIDKGEVLNELDLNFLEQVVADANAVRPMMRDNPRVLEVAGRMLELYKEITTKALANEQARAGGQK